MASMDLPNLLSHRRTPAAADGAGKLALPVKMATAEVPPTEGLAAAAEVELPTDCAARRAPLPASPKVALPTNRMAKRWGEVQHNFPHSLPPSLASICELCSNIVPCWPALGLSPVAARRTQASPMEVRILKKVEDLIRQRLLQRLERNITPDEPLVEYRSASQE